MLKNPEAIEARFWSKVNKNGPIPDHLPDLGRCWIWTASLTGPRAGYGSFAITPKLIEEAHRYAYEKLVRPIAEGMTLDHLCRVTSCVNPTHLEQVTNKENILRGTGPTAINARKTHCKRGHAFADHNLYVKPSGDRQCRTCLNTLRREHRAAEPATPKPREGGAK